MLFAGLVAFALAANTSEMLIPEGTIFSIVLNETLNTKTVQEEDPVLLTLAEDIRSAGRRGPILIPRGSSVVGRVVFLDRAGHFFGVSHLDLRLDKIVTPTGEVYDGLSTKIVEVARKKGGSGVNVKTDGALKGPSHAKRDTFLLLFPPTSAFQLLATPRRGPDIVIPVETRISVKLMSAIYVQTPTRIGEAAPSPQPAPRLAAAPAGADTLDVLVAPVAQYPDVILRDLFPALIHPSQMVQANHWVHQSRDASGSLPPSGYNESWDPSVKALTGYPDLMQRLTTDPDWMTQLGVLYSTQRVDVLNAVQRLRARSQPLRSATSF